MESKATSQEGGQGFFFGDGLGNVRERGRMANFEYGREWGVT